MSGKPYNQITSNVHITAHAMQRLQERIGSYAGYRSWQELAKTARYKGKTKGEMTSFELLWCSSNVNRKYKSSQVRIWNRFAFIFMGDNGHARTLVTVIRVM